MALNEWALTLSSGGGAGEETDIKSNNPHLTGGEKWNINCAFGFPFPFVCPFPFGFPMLASQKRIWPTICFETFPLFLDWVSLNVLSLSSRPSSVTKVRTTTKFTKVVSGIFCKSLRTNGQCFWLFINLLEDVSNIPENDQLSLWIVQCLWSSFGVSVCLRSGHTSKLRATQEFAIANCTSDVSKIWKSPSGTLTMVFRL